MNQLTLKSFITQSINEVMDGVIDAQAHAKEVNGAVNPKIIVHTGSAILTGNFADDTPEEVTPMDFDVAITVGQDDKETGRIGVFAAVMGASAQGENADHSETVSRIKFQILLKLPCQK
jgi:hypothetical protein